MKIAILGGSFNPITVSHMQIASETLKCGDFDVVQVSPCYSNPLKSNLVSERHRLKMCNLAIKDLETKRIVVSDFEISNQITDGTYSYLRKLYEKYKDNEYHYIVGGDQVNDIVKWKNYEKLIEEFGFVIFNRQGIDIQRIVFSKYTIIRSKIDPFSSTEFREQFALGNINYCKKIVSKKVLKYIVENQLYLP